MRKVVISIPDDVYEWCNKLQDIEESEADFSLLMIHAIRNGTPLPKGHGRLIDADALIKQLEEIANNEWNNHVGASKGLEDAIDIVDDAPTIIEAESEET